MCQKLVAGHNNYPILILRTLLGTQKLLLCETKSFGKGYLSPEKRYNQVDQLVCYKL